MKKNKLVGLDPLPEVRVTTDGRTQTEIKQGAMSQPARPKGPKARMTMDRFARAVREAVRDSWAMCATGLVEERRRLVTMCIGNARARFESAHQLPPDAGAFCVNLAEEVMSVSPMPCAGRRGQVSRRSRRSRRTQMSREQQRDANALDYVRGMAALRQR